MQQKRKEKLRILPQKNMELFLLSLSLSSLSFLLCFLNLERFQFQWSVISFQILFSVSCCCSDQFYFSHNFFFHFKNVLTKKIQHLGFFFFLSFFLSFFLLSLFFLFLSMHTIEKALTIYSTLFHLFDLFR